jgi:hypothetical protein
MYNNSVGKYPPAAAYCDSGAFDTMAETLRVAGYLPSAPKDPSHPTHSYSYGSVTDNSYTMSATLENTNSDLLDNSPETTSNGCTCTHPIYCVGP